jgi:glycosyltransferase involved in cell wall biosynthesis
MKGIDIIAVNDYSTDDSLDILNKFSSQCPNLRIINHTFNRGAGAARNNAIKEAKGKYITFIDSDDWIGENYLKRLYHEAERTCADIVFSNMLMVDNNNKSNEFKLFKTVHAKYKADNESTINLPYDWRPTAPWMKLFRKDFIIDNSLVFLEGINLGEDISFSWIAYFIAKKISFCEDAYYFYNLTSDSLDRRVNDNILQIFDALDFTKRIYPRFDPHNQRIKQLETLYVSHSYYQFSKILNTDNSNNIALASLFWEEANRRLMHITKTNITHNLFLNESEKEFYCDIMDHSTFDKDMLVKYGYF